jgi:hypothetical protein
MLFLIMIFVSGCVITPKNECSWVKKIEWNKDDAEVISVELIKQIKTHNEVFTELCKN